MGAVMVVSQEMEPEERQSIRRLYDALVEFKEIAPQMPVGQAAAFLLVALNENKSLNELASLADTKVSTLSRQMIDLGKRNRRMEQGYLLIDQRQNPLNLRENQYTLAPKGKNLVRRLIAHLLRSR